MWSIDILNIIFNVHVNIITVLFITKYGGYVSEMKHIPRYIYIP